MTLPPDLLKQIEVLAEGYDVEYRGGKRIAQPYYDFIAVPSLAAALYDLLVKAGPEFDEKAAKVVMNAQYRNSGFMPGARWQHSQDLAYMASMKQQLACVLVHHGKLEIKLAELELLKEEINEAYYAENQDLEAQLLEKDAEITILKQSRSQT